MRLLPYVTHSAASHSQVRTPLLFCRILRVNPGPRADSQTFMHASAQFLSVRRLWPS
jgi:hypothetical protein